MNETRLCSLEQLKAFLDAVGAGEIRVFAGGGGTDEEAQTLEAYGVEKIYLPEDGQRLGLEDPVPFARLPSAELRDNWEEIEGSVAELAGATEQDKHALHAFIAWAEPLALTAFQAEYVKTSVLFRTCARRAVDFPAYDLLQAKRRAPSGAESKKTRKTLA